MKKTYQAFGSTWEQLSLLETVERSSSVASAGSHRGLGKNTYDPTWNLEEQEVAQTQGNVKS